MNQRSNLYDCGEVTTLRVKAVSELISISFTPLCEWLLD
jgi:hypothetical protein